MTLYGVTCRCDGKTMIRTFDMFCGGGGSSYGAEMAGAEIVGGHRFVASRDVGFR